MKKFSAGWSVFLLFTATFSTTTFANPEGGQVSAGQATISARDTHTVTINQTSDKAVIDWRTFNISPQEHTQFQQPSANSITLNRIDPTNGASTIHGQLSANGQIWLMNPAGVLIGSTAHIDAAGLLITTANIQNDDFMAGNYRFVQSPNWNGAIINQGQLSTIADNGLIALVAPGVENSGLIQANLGTVILAAGKEFTVDFYGDQLIHFGVNNTVTERAVAPDGTTFPDGVSHSGKIIARGGKVILTAQTASEVMDHAINMDGYIVAKSAVARNGEIIISGQGAPVQVSGKINVTGKSKGKTGGSVKILGDKIALLDNATINASGHSGGGEILIGGNAHGAGLESNASYTYIGPNTKINASALEKGNGGEIVVWADRGTQFYGTIIAKGGAQNGNGGWVETSGKENLSFAGYVNTSAPHGTTGTLLLDPTNITVQNGGAVYTPPYDFSTAGSVTLLATGANSLSAQTSAVILEASNNITFSNAVSMAAGGSLELHAGRTIAINANVSTTNGAITMIANDSTATVANRTAGTGNITMATGTSLNAGTANITLTIDPTATGGFTPGAFSLRGVTANNITINGTNASTTVTFNGIINATNNVNITSGGAITQAAAAALTGVVLTAKTMKNAPGSAITLGSTGNDFNTVNLQARNATDTANSSGSITYRDATGVNIAALNTSTNITSFITGGTITQSGAITVTGTSSFNAGPNVIDLNTNGSNNSFAGAVSLTNSGMNDVAINNSIALVLGTVNIGQNLNVTSGGNITQVGALTVAGNSTFAVNATASNILLNTQANNFSGTVNFNGTLANIQDIGLRNTNASATVPNFSGITNLRSLTLVFNNTGIILPSLNLALAGNLTITAGGAITQTGAISVPGTASVNAGANPINLSTNGASNSFVGAVTLTTTGTNDASLNNNRALVLAASSIGRNLTITTAGAITQTGNLTVAGNASFNAGSAVINLTRTGNAFTGTVSLANTAGTVGLSKTGALILGTVNVGGALNITTTGEITQTGALTATGGITTLAAGATNNINLSDGNNNFATVAITSGKDVTLTDTNAIALSTTTVSGNYSITAGGNISQSGILTITGSTTFTATNPATDIVLNTQANNLMGSIGFGGILSNIRNISLRNTNTAPNFPDFSSLVNLQNVTLTYNNAGITIPTLTLTNGGSLTVTTGGAVSQTGPITVPGTASFSAGANTITLTNAENAFTGAVSLTNSGANDVALTNNMALVLGASTIAGGNLSVIATGAITQTGGIIANGALKAAKFSAGANNNITLTSTTNNFNTLEITDTNNATIRDANSVVLGTITINGNLAITTTGAITQNSQLTISGAASFTAGANAITLTNVANTFNGVVSLSNSGTGTTTSLTNSSALTLGTSSVGTGALTIIAGGPITQIGALTVPGISNFNAGSNAINLSTNGGSNRFTGAVSLSNIGSNNVTLHNNRALVLGTSTIGQNLTITTAGAITQTGALTVGGTSSFSSGGNAITLTHIANAFTNAVSLTNSGAVATALTNSVALILGASSVGTGALTIVATGPITQTGTLTVPGVSNFNAGANAINLSTNGAANSFTGAVTLTNSGVNDVTLNNNRALVLAASNIGQNLSITTAGTITQTGALTVAGTASFFSGANAITLTNASNAFRGAISLTNTLNNVSITNNRALALGASSITSGNFTAVAAGSITQTGALTISGTPTFTVSVASSDISLSSHANTFNTTPIITNNGNIRDLGLRNTTATAVIPTLPTGIRNLTLIFNNTAMVMPAINISGNLTVTAGGAITQSGSILAASGITTLETTASSNITLNNAANNFSTLAINNANNVSVNDINAIILGASSIKGNLNLITTGAITQSGALTITGTSGFSSGANAITLTNAANAFTGTVSLSNTLNGASITNNSALVLGTLSVLNGNLSINATGSITQNNAISLTASASLSGNGITLNNTINGAQNLSLNAGYGDITVNAAIGNVTPLTALNILNVNNLTNNAMINTLAYTQNAGTGIVNFGTGGLNATGATSITTNSINGTLYVKSLSLGTNFANLTGTVNTLSNEAAIQIITLLNTIGPGTHFFDGIDMYTYPPLPPTPAPSPLAANFINPAVLFPYIFTESGVTTNPTTVILQDYDLSLDTNKQLNSNEQNCIKLSSDISICAK